MGAAIAGIAARADAQVQVVARTVMDKVTVSRAAQGLSKRRLVTRAENKADGRSHVLDLTPEGRRLYAEIAPLAMAYEAAFSQQIAGLRDAPWGIVEVATEFEAAGPEVLARFRRQFGWCTANGCAFLAVGGFKRYLADQVFSELPFNTVRYFEQEAAAIHWLGGQLGGDVTPVS